MQGCAASSFEGGEGSILEGETDRRERGWRWRAGSSATEARTIREEGEKSRGGIVYGQLCRPLIPTALVSYRTTHIGDGFLHGDLHDSTSISNHTVIWTTVYRIITRKIAICGVSVIVIRGILSMRHIYQVRLLATYQGV
jgi:hypothetical protein